MSATHLIHNETARHEITRRLRAADEQRLRRLARHAIRRSGRTHDAPTFR